VVLGARHRIGQAAQAELVQPRQEFLLVLAAEEAKDQLRGIARTAPRDGSEDPR
jgi:hypothetical protein